jgi:type VI secretion system protein ImpK
MKTERATEDRSRIPDPRPGHDRLAVLYQAVLTAVVRVQSRREKILDVVGFRKKMRAALRDVERAATTFNYDSEDIHDAQLAVVAFLDEVILVSDDPSKEEWMKLPLAHDMLGQPVAGEVFFERLEALLRSPKDSSRLADLLEVYLLCLTLGFEGKYSGAGRAELQTLMTRAKARIEDIRQNRGNPLSPDADLPDDIVESAVITSNTTMLARITVGVAIGALILFIAAWIHLSSGVNQVFENLK